MRWGFTIPGQPPSLNRMYRIKEATAKGKTFPTLFKTEQVQAYQRTARLVIAASKPSRWRPTEQIRVYYRFYLEREIDCDNIQKALNDTIELATGINDDRYLPCVIMKEIVRKKKDARVEVVIEDIVSPSVDLPTWSTIRTP